MALLQSLPQVTQWIIRFDCSIWVHFKHACLWLRCGRCLVSGFCVRYLFFLNGLGLHCDWEDAVCAHFPWHYTRVWLCSQSARSCYNYLWLVKVKKLLGYKSGYSANVTVQLILVFALHGRIYFQTVSCFMAMKRSRLIWKQKSLLHSNCLLRVPMGNRSCGAMEMFR